MAIIGEKLKEIQVGKDEVKLSLIADDMILYIENLKNSTGKLLHLINEYSKITGCKINTQKLLAFLYTNNQKAYIEIKEIKERNSTHHCNKKNETPRNKTTQRDKRPVCRKLQDTDERNQR